MEGSPSGLWRRS